MNILIIGGGNMGLTYAQAFINSRVVEREQLTILEHPSSNRIEELKRLNLGKITTTPTEVQHAELIILAVKPQDITSLFAQIKEFITPNQIIVSIMAGVTIDTIKIGLGAEKIVRAMPNLPAQIRHGMTGFTCTESVNRHELSIIQNLLSQTGKTLQVENESDIDVVTALSGSGPAYVYYFMQSMMKTATEMGMSDAAAELMTVETFLGATTLFQQQSLSCQDWINKVSSKGGTTEAAITTFNQEELNQKISKGINAALNRARELGNQ